MDSPHACMERMERMGVGLGTLQCARELACTAPCAMRCVRAATEEQLLALRVCSQQGSICSVLSRLSHLLVLLRPVHGSALLPRWRWFALLGATAGVFQAISTMRTRVLNKETDERQRACVRFWIGPLLHTHPHCDFANTSWHRSNPTKPMSCMF